MTQLTFDQAQADMRRGYVCGSPGLLVSGLVWLVAGMISLMVSERSGVYALLIGGTFIHPLSVVLAKLLGSPGRHSPGNALGTLAAEGTFWLLAGIAIAYGMHVLRLEWFFPAMLLLIGGRYLTFQTIYGLRAYWFCGALLCGAGLALALVRAPAHVSAFAGAGTELAFAVFIYMGARRSTSTSD